MHRAKVFLTVCAGLFLLALSYHLGARSAQGQSIGAGQLDCASAEDDGRQVTVVINRMMTTCFNGGGYVFNHPIPGTGRILACASGVVLLEDGRVYTSGGSNSPREPSCQFTFDPPTSLQQETWGALKSRYRGERGAGQPRER